MIELEIGKEYNYLTVLEKMEGYFYLLKCRCGKEKKAKKYDILTGNIKTCGCRTKNSKMAGFNTLYSKYKHGAKKRNLEWNLSVEQFENFISKNCYYCNSIPKQTMYSDANKCQKSKCIYNGIDRIDNNKGYTLENCVTSCKRCNYFKHIDPQGDFFSWIKNTYHFLKDCGKL